MDFQSAFPILSPKLQIPPSRLQIVPRERLLRVINEGLHRKLTLISAPAGYGKTTFLSEWASQCGWPLAWITLSAGDDDPERFFAYLVSAIQTASPSLTNLEQFFGARFSLQPTSIETLMIILINQLAALPERLVIVLDDYHIIEDEETHSLLNQLIEHLPGNIHMIVSTRTVPPLRLARLRAKDQLNEIGERDLRFTDDEAQVFLAEIMGLNLTGEQISALGSRTEGWVTGLQLVGLSLKERQDPDDLIRTLDGAHRYILDYLLEEVFADLSPALQTFLLRASIVERLSPGLCEVITGDAIRGDHAPSSAKEILAYLDSANLFVIPLDNQRQWYRFHPLFAEFLRDRLESQDPTICNTLHRKAAEWHADHGLSAEAIHHYLAAGEPDLAADLILLLSKSLLGRGEITTLLRWIERLPEETIFTKPQLVIARAWVLLIRDPMRFWETIHQQITRLQKLLDVAPQGLLVSLTVSEPDSPRRAILAELAMLYAFIKRDNSDSQDTIAYFNAALEYLPQSDQLSRGFTLAGLGSTFARIGAIKQAEETFAQAAQICLAIKSNLGYVASTDWQATMQAEGGQLVRAAETYRQAIQTLSSLGYGPLPLSGHVYVGFASILFEWNALEEALENVDLGLQIGAQVKDIDALLSGYPIQARAYLALNKRIEALDALQNLEQQARQTNSPACLNDALAQKAIFALAMGELETAQRWAAARGITQSALNELDQPLREIEYIAYARLLIAERKYPPALDILEELLAAYEQMGRMRAFIEILTLQALCRRAMGYRDEAIQILARALLIAEPEGYLRTFIDAGPAMAALLRSAGSQGHSLAYVQRLLAVFGESFPNADAPIEALSEREIEVLRLVARGLTNAEVASELVIAQSTVKTHINRIYSKLGVRTRTQAIARARQFRIIS